ncbi:hypothetical protein TWF281_001784 [Arthrobotrys megalospora]
MHVKLEPPLFPHEKKKERKKDAPVIVKSESPDPKAKAAAAAVLEELNMTLKSSSIFAVDRDFGFVDGWSGSVISLSTDEDTVNTQLSDDGTVSHEHTHVENSATTSADEPSTTPETGYQRRITRLFGGYIYKWKQSFNSRYNIPSPRIPAGLKNFISTLQTLFTNIYNTINSRSTGSLALWLAGIILCLGVYILPNSHVQTTISAVSIYFTPATPVIPAPDPLFVKAARQNSALIELQRMAARSDPIPLQMSRARHDFWTLLIELRGPGLVSADTLETILPRYDKLVDDVIDGIQDSRAKTLSLMEKTIIYTSWAKSELQRIDQQDNSLMGLIISSTPKLLWPGQKSLTEKEVEATFYHYTDKLGDLAQDVIDEYLGLRRHLTELKEKLRAIAEALNTDKAILHDAKLIEDSTWRWLLHLHREKIKDVNGKAKICSDFYRYSNDARMVVEGTITKMSEMRAGMNELRKDIKVASLERGKPYSLKLTIDILEASLNKLRVGPSEGASRVGYR